MNKTELKNELNRYIPEWKKMTNENRHGELLEQIAHFFTCFCKDAGEIDMFASFQEFYFMFRQLNSLHFMRGNLSCPLALTRCTLEKEMRQTISVVFGKNISDMVNL